MKSNCCQANMLIQGRTTNYFVCEKCQESCDPDIDINGGSPLHIIFLNPEDLNYKRAEILIENNKPCDAVEEG